MHTLSKHKVALPDGDHQAVVAVAAHYFPQALEGSIARSTHMPHGAAPRARPFDATPSPFSTIGTPSPTDQGQRPLW